MGVQMNTNYKTVAVYKKEMVAQKDTPSLTLMMNSVIMIYGIRILHLRVTQGVL